MPIQESRCKGRVSHGDWGRSHQCKNAAKLDGFCMKHHPAKVAEREAARQAEWDKKRKQSPVYKLKKTAEALEYILRNGLTDRAVQIATKALKGE